MSVIRKSKQETLTTVMRRMRESSGLTMRQAAGMIGISHVAISQFENQKLSLPFYRIEQLVRAYGFTMDDFNKIVGNRPVASPKDNCLAMINRMSEEQLSALQAVMGFMLLPRGQVQDADGKTSNAGNI